MKTTLNIRIDSEIKKEVQQLFADLGIDVTTAITLYFKQCIIKKGIPFELKTYRTEIKKQK